MEMLALGAHRVAQSIDSLAIAQDSRVKILTFGALVGNSQQGGAGGRRGGSGGAVRASGQGERADVLGPVRGSRGGAGAGEVADGEVGWPR